MKLRLRVVCLPMAVSILAVPGLRGENLNVSPIAISGRNLDWSEESSTLKWIGGATYTYYQMGRARVQTDTSDYFAPSPWSAAWQYSPSDPVLSRHRVGTQPRIPIQQHSLSQINRIGSHHGSSWIRSE